MTEIYKKMNCFEKLRSIQFNPKEYDPHMWFVEQDAFNLCAFDDEPIDIPVFIISEYPMAHYKYSINICCEKNLNDFYECLGTQELKIIFTHQIDEDFVRRHEFNIIPDTDLERDFYIYKNELYLDSNEVELESHMIPNEIFLSKNDKEQRKFKELRELQDALLEEDEYSDDEISSEEDIGSDEDIEDQIESLKLEGVTEISM